MNTHINIYWIDGIESGRLAIMPRPRGGDWLDDEIRSLKNSGVDVVVSLLERIEINELDIVGEEALCEKHGMTYLSFPIVDRSLPLSQQDALSFAGSIVERLHNGESIVIHCHAGIGRSSMMAACAMALAGARVEDAFARIEHARGRPVPDTPEQRAWVIELFEQ